MANGTPQFTSAVGGSLDTADTLGPIGGLTNSVTLGSQDLTSGTGHNDQISITKNLVNTLVQVEQAVGQPGNPGNGFNGTISALYRALFTTKTIIPLFAQDVHPPSGSTAYATFATRSGGMGVYRFASTSANNTALYLAFAPEFNPNMLASGTQLSSGLIFNIFFMASASGVAAGSGANTVSWQVSIANLNSASNLDSITFGGSPGGSGTGTVPNNGTTSTLAGATASVTVGSGNLQSLATGNAFLVQVQRAGAGDTYTAGSVDLIGIECRYGS